MCIYIRNQIKILQRNAAKEEQKQAVFFFFLIKVYILLQWCQSCLQTRHFAQWRRRELLLSPFPSFEFFEYVFETSFQDLSLPDTVLFFFFQIVLMCPVSFPRSRTSLSVVLFCFSPLCLSLSATAQSTTRELHHSLLLPTEQDEGDFSSKTLKANATQHSSCKSPSTLKELWEEIEALLLYQKHSK